MNHTALAFFSGHLNNSMMGYFGYLGRGIAWEMTLMLIYAACCGESEGGYGMIP